MLVWYHWGYSGWIVKSAWHSDRKGLPGNIPKIEETVVPVSTCGRELLRGWWWLIGLVVSFMIFTVSVWNISDTTTYFYVNCYMDVCKTLNSYHKILATNLWIVFLIGIIDLNGKDVNVCGLNLCGSA
jgi:hypothetical protein